MESIVFQYARNLADLGWLDDLARRAELQSLLAEAAGVASGMFGGAGGVMEEVVTTAARPNADDALRNTLLVTDFLARNLVFDYADPLGGSYLLEAATLLPIAKIARSGRLRMLATPETRRVFWSGGRAAEDAAQTFAKQNGGVVIGETCPGRSLANSTRGAAWNDVRPMWVDLSREFARGARGPVDVFQNARGLSLDSIWRTEFQELLRNPSVTSINYHVVMPDGSVVPVR